MDKAKEDKKNAESRRTSFDDTKKMECLSRWIPIAWMISRFYNRFRWSNQEELKNAQKDEVTETRGSRLEKIEEDLEEERAEVIKNHKENVYATGNGEGGAIVRPKVAQNLKKRKANKILTR